MENILKKFINWMQFDGIRDNVVYSDDDNLKLKHEYRDGSFDEYDYKMIDKKLFKNQNNVTYTVNFIEEKLDGKNMYIYTLIEINNDKYICLEYDYEQDEYALRGPGTGYIYGNEVENDSDYISYETKVELKEIIKQSFEHVELKLNKRILRLLDTESKESAIENIKKFI